MALIEKPIKEWYSELPSDVKEKALNNLRYNRGDIMVIDLFDAICQGFTWKNTPKGEEYSIRWNPVRDSIEFVKTFSDEDGAITINPATSNLIYIS